MGPSKSDRETGPYYKTILVTGSAGFIGQHLVAALVARDNYVLTCDRATTSTDDILLMELPEVDVCYHLAAVTDALSADTNAMYQTNLLGTERLLRKYGPKVIFASTCAVNYPGTPYADSKRAAEALCRSYGARVLRLCNIFGPGGHGVIDNFGRHDVLSVRGDGSQLRTYAHVNQAVRSFLRMVADPPGTLRILPGAELTVNEIIEAFHPGKRVDRRPPVPNDILDGRQIYEK